MPADKTVDTVLLILALGALTLGLGSVALGWIVKTYDRVMSRMPAQTEQTAQTDRQTDYVSEADLWLDRLEVDRTKAAVIELLVYSGWEVGQIRGVLKGDNGTIGTDIEAAKIRLGMVEPARQIRVRDDHGERLIPIDA
jgi:hypothetical protein